MPSTRATGKIDFAKVNFSYPSRSSVPVLVDFSLKIHPGKTVALVGPSGRDREIINRDGNTTAPSRFIPGRDGSPEKHINLLD